VRLLVVGSVVGSVGGYIHIVCEIHSLCWLLGGGGDWVFVGAFQTPRSALYGYEMCWCVWGGLPCGSLCGLGGGQGQPLSQGFLRLFGLFLITKSLSNP
jgi:hypothetical protein